MALVSAHRGGAGDDRTAENSLAAFEAAIAMGCDYVEFDVRLTADGHPVVFHNDELPGESGGRSIAGHRLDELAGPALLGLGEVLELVRGRIGAHVDLKVRGHEIAVVEQVVSALGSERVVVTTAEDSSVRELMRWSGEHAPGLLVGLSSSARAAGPHRLARLRVRIESAFPRLRLRLSGANLVVAHKTVARLTLKAYARRRGLPLLVWTVDRPGELAHWMNDPDVWIVTTNHPQRALDARR